MATDVQEITELELLHRFIGEELVAGRRRRTVDECLAEFRQYQRELERLREEIRPALERSLRGESPPFDVEEIKRRVRERLAGRGITD